MGNEGQRYPDEMLIGERPAEEDEIGPEVEQLGYMKGGNMVGFVTQDNAAVDDHKSSKSNNKSDERLQDFGDVEETLWLGEQFEGTSDDRDHGFGVVWRS